MPSKLNPIRLLLLFMLSGSTVLPGIEAAEKHALLQYDFPFQAACVGAKFPENNVALKGLAIQLGNDSSVLFDTELMRMAAGWTGGFITPTGVAFNGDHGGHPMAEGNQQFGTPAVPGWAGPSGEFTDPRPEPFGALPPEWARWNGIYVAGDQVVLSYTVLGSDILEQPSISVLGESIAFIRTFQVGSVTAPLTALLCEAEGIAKTDGTSATIEAPNGQTTWVGTKGLPKGAALKIIGQRVLLSLPKGITPTTFSVVICRAITDFLPTPEQLLAGKPRIAPFENGSPTRWPEEVVTKGALAVSKTPDGAYVTDSLTAPLDNPWKRRVRFGGLDFFKDGKRAALCTWEGDVWIVSGIDEKLEKLTWRRFASGMYETLGLKIVDDVIYTSGRDQITRYHDLNKDGEADYYESVNNQFTSSAGFHEFLFDLQTDRAGNFYFSKAGPVRSGGRDFETVARNAGTLMKLSKDGSKLEVVASGFRAPNGIGVGPNGELTTGDNEGTWVPTCPINWVEPGGFYGVEQLAHRTPIPEFNQPLCWLSHNGWDNSGGGQVWVESNKWGPYQGELLHCSYGECALYLVMKQPISNGSMQGGVVRFPLRFTSSAMRPKFNPVDGQLYVAGLQGWQTKAVRLSGLDRVRYTGKPVYSVRELKVDKSGVHLTFTQPLDPRDASDVQNFAVERWNYKRTADYGSPEVSVSDPSRNGHDKVQIVFATVSPDKHTVSLRLADHRPVMQMKITYNITSEDGTIIDQEILHTIHEIQ